MRESKAMKTKAKGEGYFFAQETLPYQAKGSVIAQIQPNACVAATARMLLKDAGLAVSEAELRSRFEIDDDGTSPTKIPSVLKEFGLKYDYRRDLTMEDIQNATKQDSAILYVAKSLQNKPGHIIILDGIEDNYALIRDSQDGVSYKLSIKDLETFWINKESGLGKAAVKIK